MKTRVACTRSNHQKIRTAKLRGVPLLCKVRRAALMLLLLVCMEGLQGSLDIFSLTTSIHTRAHIHTCTNARTHSNMLRKETIGLAWFAV